MMELSDLLKSGRSDHPCLLDPNCLYVEGHTCDCTPVEIGKHVQRKREDSWRQAYRNRLTAILDAAYAIWFDQLIAAGTSPLLFVGWRRRGAGTWHRDRFCKRDRANGQLEPLLYLEGVSAKYGNLRACAGCGKLTDAEMAVVREDWRQLRALKREKAEGLCWTQGHYADCGADVVPGTMTCAKHVNALTEACRVGGHEDCDKVLSVHTRKDGSTYITECPCPRCDHPGAKRE